MLTSFFAIALWFAAPHADALATCYATMTEPSMGDLKQVPGAFDACRDVTLEAHRQSIPTALVAAMGYVETRHRPHLVGSQGELGSLQVSPKYWPQALNNPNLAAMRALMRANALARDKYGPERAGWLAALAHYNGGMRPNWNYAYRVINMAERIRDRRGFGDRFLGRMTQL